MNSEEFTKFQLDIINELANIGGGNAATAISQLVNKPINMSVPEIEILNYAELYNKIMPEDEMVTAVTMRALGDASGSFLFISKEEDLEPLIDMMIPEGFKLTDIISDSAVKELVNILVTSYLNAIAKMINVNLLSSVPILTKDMFGAILSTAYIETGQYDENVMIIKNEYIYEDKRIESSLYYIPEPGILNKLFELLGVN